MSAGETEDPIDRLIEYCDLESLPRDARETLAECLKRRVEDEIGDRLIRRMTKEQVDVFTQINSGDLDYIKEWLRKNDPKSPNAIATKTPEELVSYAQALFIISNVPSYHRDVRIVLNRQRIKLKKRAPEILKRKAERFPYCAECDFPEPENI